MCVCVCVCFLQSDCSQLETKLSGVQMPSAGKRDSLLSRAAELKDHSSKSLAKPVSVRMGDV